MTNQSQQEPLFPFPPGLSPEEEAERFDIIRDLIKETARQLESGEATITPVVYFSSSLDRHLYAWFEDSNWPTDNSCLPFDKFVGALVEEQGFVSIAAVKTKLLQAAEDITPNYDGAAGRARIDQLCERLQTLYEFVAAQPKPKKPRKSKPKPASEHVVTAEPAPEYREPETEVDAAEGKVTYANDVDEKLSIIFLKRAWELYDDLMRRRGQRGVPFPIDEQAAIAEGQRRLNVVLNAEDVTGGEKHNLMACLIKRIVPNGEVVEITWR